jgi:hypothetical protein
MREYLVGDLDVGVGGADFAGKEVLYETPLRPMELISVRFFV